MKYWYLVLLICGHWVLFAREHQATLHVVTVTDTTSPQMTTVSEADSVRVQETFKNIASHVGLRLDSKIFRGENNPLGHLKDWIRSTRIASKDVVVFYYSGKGFAKHQTMKAAKRFAEHRIANVLRSKNPRLALAIFDCYGRRIAPGDNIKLNFFKGIHGPLPSHPQGLCSLFRKNSGVVIACSDRDPAKGWYFLNKDLVGGAFTTGFLIALQLWAAEPRVSWGNVLCLMRRGVQVSYAHQAPFFLDRARSHTGLNGIK